MAKQMSYVDASGVTHAESYWRPVLVAVDKAGKLARAVFYGYATKDAADGNKAPVGVKEYGVSGADYDTYFGVSALNPFDENPYKAAYTLAMATKEGYVDPKEAADPDFVDTRKSFFADATDV